MFEVIDNKNLKYGVFDTDFEARDMIRKLIDESGFKSYYWRQSYLQDGGIWIDYGSHSHFFYIIPVAQVERREL
jgi:hypothetical protein